MKREKKKTQLSALTVSGVETGNDDVDRVLAIPIKRGAFNEISGNGRHQLQLRRWALERVDDRLDHGISKEYLNSLPTTCAYFACPLCRRTI